MRGGYLGTNMTYDAEELHAALWVALYAQDYIKSFLDNGKHNTEDFMNLCYAIVKLEDHLMPTTSYVEGEFPVTVYEKITDRADEVYKEVLRVNEAKQEEVQRSVVGLATTSKQEKEI
jgi:hypothetical protein